MSPENFTTGYQFPFTPPPPLVLSLIIRPLLNIESLDVENTTP